MKNLFYLFCLSITIFSCSEELEVEAPFIETPIIFSLIEPKQDFQYFRVQKAFSGIVDNALTLAQDPKNIYYDSGEIELTLLIVDPEEPDRPYFDFPLVYSRCDTCKDPGIFNNDYLPIYHTYSFLPVDHESTTPLTTTLFFKNLITGHTAESNIGLVPCFEILNPKWDCSYQHSTTFFIFDDFVINFLGPEHGRLVNLSMWVLYFEVPLNSTTIVEKTTENFPMPIIKFMELDQETGYEYVFRKGSKAFGDYLNAAIDTSNNSKVRYRIIEGGVATMTFEIYNDDFYLHNLYENQVNIDQVSLAYTNIDNGLGVIAAKVHRVVPGIVIQIDNEDYWDNFPSLKHR
jgi:hypothetical protein